jgi:DeoR/GlpR family transcriptional regulator of sugar metabolism
LASYSDFNKVTKIITDDSAPKKVIKELRRMGIEIEIIK